MKIPEVKKMSTQAINKPATNKQLAYIQRLQKEIGTDGPEIKDNISRYEASKIISDLIAKACKNGTHNSQDRNTRINEPRLGMAMKECFKVRKKNSWDIYDKHREAFIKDVINTYNLFTEITMRLAQNAEKKPSS
jgi:hypothetical protein